MSNWGNDRAAETGTQCNAAGVAIPCCGGCPQDALCSTCTIGRTDDAAPMCETALRIKCMEWAREDYRYGDDLDAVIARAAKYFAALRGINF